jgi:hypothetical protein
MAPPEVFAVWATYKLEVQLLARAMTYKYAFFLAFLRVALKLDYVLITGSPQRGKLRSSRPLPDI